MSKNSTKWHYEFTDWCKYKCMECGRTMHEPTPHICNGMFRKHRNFYKEGDTVISAELKPLSPETISAQRGMARSDTHTVYFENKAVATITRLPDADKDDFDKLIDYFLSKETI